jgi:hypothetical protein
VYIARNDTRIEELTAERRPGRPKEKELLELEDLRKREAKEFETGFGECRGALRGSPSWRSSSPFPYTRRRGVTSLYVRHLESLCGDKPSSLGLIHLFYLLSSQRPRCFRTPQDRSSALSRRYSLLSSPVSLPCPTLCTHLCSLLCDQLHMPSFFLLVSFAVPFSVFAPPIASTNSPAIRPSHVPLRSPNPR